VDNYREEYQEEYTFNHPPVFELPEVGVKALEYIYGADDSKQIEELLGVKPKEDYDEEVQEDESTDIEVSQEETTVEELFADNEQEADLQEDIPEEGSQEHQDTPLSETAPAMDQTATSSSVYEMLEILTRQAMKTHEQSLWRPQVASKPIQEKKTEEITQNDIENKQLDEVEEKIEKDTPEISETTANERTENSSNDTAPAIIDIENKSAVSEKDLVRQTAELLTAQLSKISEISSEAKTKPIPGLNVNDEQSIKNLAQRTAELLAAQSSQTPISERMSILSGAPPAPARKKSRSAEKSKTKERKGKDGQLLPKEVIEAVDFLDESIEQYEKYVENIGRNGLAAANLGYYRDDIQDMLDILKFEDTIDLATYWERITKIDLRLRMKAPMFVREIGYNNFKQYQIINDPPLTNWWWYLNRDVAPPLIEPKFWEFWKKL
jgi:hypothetical protein